MNQTTSYTTLLDHILLLTEKGYSGPTFPDYPSASSLLLQLEQQFNLHKQKSPFFASPYFFAIHQRPYLHQQPYPICCELFYRYTAEKEQLDIVRLKLYKEKRAIHIPLNGRSEDLPSFQDALLFWTVQFESSIADGHYKNTDLIQKRPLSIVTSKKLKL